MRTHIAAFYWALAICCLPAQAQQDPAQPRESHLVLLPGYLATKLYTCPTEKSELSECVLFYGDERVTFIRQDLSIKPGAIYKYSIIDTTRAPFDFYVKLRAFLTKYARENLQFVFEGKNFYGVPYDWRRGIRENAALLHEALCAKAASAQNRDIEFFILAHSMGGNVLKEWMRSHSRVVKCPNGRLINLRAVAFAGSPLLGSVQPLQALFKGFPILPFYHPAGWFEQIGPSIVQSSIWMQSTFDIMPAFANMPCVAKFAPGQRGIAQRKPYPIQAEGNVKVELYDEGVWTSLNFFRYFRGQNFQIPSRDSLREKLDTAAQTSCTLAYFNPKDSIKEKFDYISPVVYLAGRQEVNSTPVVLRLGKDATSEPVFVPGAGDGTVPEYSASDELVSLTGDVITVPGGSEDLHLTLLNATETRSVLEAWLTHAGFLHHARAPGNPVPTPGKNEKKGGVADPSLLPIPPSPKRWRDADVQFVIERNRAALLARKMAVHQYAKEARSRPANFQRVISLSIAASLAPDGSEEQIEWLLTAAQTAVSLQNAKAARALIEFAAEQLLAAEAGKYSPQKIAEYLAWFKTFDAEIRVDSDPDTQRIVALIRDVINRYTPTRAMATTAWSFTGGTQWTKICTAAEAIKSEEREGAERKLICLTHQDHAAMIKNGRTTVSVGVREVIGDNDKFLVVTLPPKLSKMDSLRVNLYRKEQWAKVEKDARLNDDFTLHLNLQTRVCNASGCTAETGIQPAVVREFLQEGGIAVLATGSDGEVISLLLPLAGFSDAYNRQGSFRSPSSATLLQALATAEILARMHADTEQLLSRIKRRFPPPAQMVLGASKKEETPDEQERLLRRYLEWERITPPR